MNSGFEVRNASGQTPVKLTAGESYLGGASLGGAGFLDMEDLTRRLGETMAEKAAQWSRGEKVD